MNFPYGDLKVGDSVFARSVRHRGDKESDALFGAWGPMHVRHVQHDKVGRLSCVAFTGYEVEFDPRNDWDDTGPYPCLINENNQLQISRRI